MRKILPALLIVVGTFFLVVAIVALTWVPGQVERTPLDTDNVTDLSGTAGVFSGGDALDEGPVKAWSTNAVDSEASDDDNVVFNTSLCLVHDEGGIDGCVDADDPQDRLISAETTLFVTDRHTAMTVDNDGYLPETAPQLEGLQNKWPFDAQKKAYPVWDDIIAGTVEAEYLGEDEIDGLKVYKYEYHATADSVVVAGDITGTYDATYTFYIEPRTGSIIKQVVHQERVADNGTPLLELDLAFTDEQVQKNVDDANEAISTLRLLEDIVPIVGLAAGVPLILLGLALLLLARRRRTAAPADQPKATAGA